MPAKDKTQAESFEDLQSAPRGAYGPEPEGSRVGTEPQSDPRKVASALILNEKTFAWSDLRKSFPELSVSPDLVGDGGRVYVSVGIGLDKEAREYARGLGFSPLHGQEAIQQATIRAAMDALEKLGAEVFYEPDPTPQAQTSTPTRDTNAPRPPPAPRTEPRQPDNPVDSGVAPICADCGGEIKGFTSSQGTVFTPGRWADFMTDKHDKPLCQACSRAPQYRTSSGSGRSQYSR